MELQAAAMERLREASEVQLMCKADAFSHGLQEWHVEREAFRAAMERVVEAEERLVMARHDISYTNGSSSPSLAVTEGIQFPKK